ncbi:porin family protein [Nonlabens antarcticus]|uniref:porin family protein n=1 Tax=Nonlabens antarcticus TaxID=392714 RepID=UPI001891D478|nr:porin family protein [Nonlabens antarcticus]
MKKLCTAAFVLIGIFSFAQTDSGFGIKGGLNYGSSGEFKDEINSNTEDPDSKIGFHLGVFAKADLGPIYVRPELIYTKLNSEYSIGDFEVQKLDLPILVGVNVIGPLNVFAGPSLQYILDTDLEGFDVDDVKDQFSVGAQFGVGLDLGRLGIDLRYERGFKDNEVTFFDINRSRIDTRPEQLIIALSLSL